MIKPKLDWTSLKKSSYTELFKVERIGYDDLAIVHVTKLTKFKRIYYCEIRSATAVRPRSFVSKNKSECIDFIRVSFYSPLLSEVIN